MPNKKNKKKKRIKKTPGVQQTRLHKLAWTMARMMTKLPQREHINETFIDWEGHYGCIPAGTLYGYQYCQNCFYVQNNGCMKIQVPTQWRLAENGKLTRNEVSARRM